LCGLEIASQVASCQQVILFTFREDQFWNLKVPRSIFVNVFNCSASKTILILAWFGNQRK